MVRQQNAGSANARNFGIANSSAPLLAYLDDDNLWYPEFLYRAVDIFSTRQDVDILYGALVSHEHRLRNSCILWKLFNRDHLEIVNYIDTNVIVHRRKLFDEYGGWDGSVRKLCDWDLVLRYTSHGPALALNVLAAYYRNCDGDRVRGPSDPLTFQEIRRRIDSGSYRPVSPNQAG